MADERSQDYIAPKSRAKREKSEAHKKVMEFIGQTFQVHLNDGRIIEGQLMATDKDANMILTKAEESWSQNPDQKPRFLGQAMISKIHVKSMNKSPRDL